MPPDEHDGPEWMGGWRVALLLALLLALPARAQPMLQLDARQAVSAGGFMSMLRDPRGDLLPQEAAAARTWQDLKESLSAAYTPDVIWLRLRLQTPPAGNAGCCSSAMPCWTMSACTSGTPRDHGS